jgi:hypothetical protein
MLKKSKTKNMFQKNRILPFVLFFVFSLVHSQESLTAMQVLKKTTAFYNSQTYCTYGLKYVLYIDYKTVTPHTDYSGIFINKNNVVYFKIKDTEFVSFNDVGIKINHDQKAFVFQKDKSELETSPIDVSKYLKGFVSKLETSSEYYICELKPAGKMSQIMASKIVIYINKKDFSIAKQSLYFVEKMQSKDAKGKVITTVPRLETIFSKRAKNEANDDLLTSKNNYFTEKNGKLVMSKKLEAYQIIKS